MPANDTLRRPQAKTTFRASVSFLILMVLSMREVAGLCSGVMICFGAGKPQRHTVSLRDNGNTANPTTLPSCTAPY